MKKFIDVLSCVLWLAAGMLICGVSFRAGMPGARSNVVLGAAAALGAIGGAAAFAFLRSLFLRWVILEYGTGDIFRYSLTRARRHFLSVSFGALLGMILAASLVAGMRGEATGAWGLVSLGMLSAWFIGYPIHAGYTVRGMRLKIDPDGVELSSRRKIMTRITWGELEEVLVELPQAALLIAGGRKRLLFNRPDRRFAWHIDGFDALLERVAEKAGGRASEVDDLLKAAAKKRKR